MSTYHPPHCDPDCEWRTADSSACCTPSPWEQELMAQRDTARAEVEQWKTQCERAVAYMTRDRQRMRIAEQEANRLQAAFEANLRELPGGWDMGERRAMGEDG